MLAADMGTGKTPVSIRAAEALRAESVLVVCPAVACINWTREIARWAPGRDVVYARDRATDVGIADAEIVVVSYDRMRSKPVHAALMKRRWGALVLDEAHYLKGFSQRTRAVYGARYDRGTNSLAARAGRVWPLTGTPILNHPGELWTHLHALHPDFATESYGRFVEQYCTVRQVPFSPRPVITGGKNLGHLRERVGDWLLRIRKADVLKDLPALRVDTLTVEAPEVEKALHEYETGPDGDRLRALLNGDSMDMECFATLRRLTGTAKAAAVVRWLEDELAGGLGKVVVFAHHRDVISRIATGLAAHGVVTVSGVTPPTARQQAIDSFQTDPSVRVFVGQLQSASTAISLTAASDIVFAEADWTPAINAQAISRCHRHGQTAPVLARFITLADSIDEAVMRAVAHKTATISEMGLG